MSAVAQRYIAGADRRRDGVSRDPPRLFETAFRPTGSPTCSSAS